MGRRAGEQGEGDGYEGARGKKARLWHQVQSRYAVLEEGHAPLKLPIVMTNTLIVTCFSVPRTETCAEVQAVGHDCDLAILSVEDEAFWTSPTSMLPLRMGDVPALQQDVVVIG